MPQEIDDVAAAAAAGAISKGGGLIKTAVAVSDKVIVVGTRKHDEQGADRGAACAYILIESPGDDNPVKGRKRNGMELEQTMKTVLASS